MTVCDVVLFLHITSAIIMYASLTVDWLAIAGLRVTWTANRHEYGFALWRCLPPSASGHAWRSWEQASTWP